DSHLTHSHYAALKTKDAICDQFVERTGRRPSVDVEQPLVGLNLHIYRDHAVLSLDSSGDSLHKRGYRPILTKAPLNEALAAGVFHLLQFAVRDMRAFMPPDRPGTLLCNPPYGERIGEERELKTLYRALGEVFRQRCAGWQVYVFTGNAMLAREIGLEPARQI